MPRGIIQWLTSGGIGNSATSTLTVTNGSTVYQAITGPQWLTQTTGGASTLAQIYRNHTTGTAVTQWIDLGTATTGNVYWINSVEDDVQQSQYVVLAQQRVADQARLVEEQRRLLVEEEARRYREQAELEVQRRAAYQRSRELLLQHLTPAQRKTFEENQWFIVQGGMSKKHYRIRTTGYTGNIEELDHRQRMTHRLCGHLASGYALHDHHVAQKISLEWDEDAFVQICNRYVA